MWKQEKYFNCVRFCVRARSLFRLRYNVRFVSDIYPRGRARVSRVSSRTRRGLKEDRSWEDKEGWDEKKAAKVHRTTSQLVASWGEECAVFGGISARLLEIICQKSKPFPLSSSPFSFLLPPLSITTSAFFLAVSHAPHCFHLLFSQTLCFCCA